MRILDIAQWMNVIFDSSHTEGALRCILFNTASLQNSYRVHRRSDLPTTRNHCPALLHRPGHYNEAWCAIRRSSLFIGKGVHDFSIKPSLFVPGHTTRRGCLMATPWLWKELYHEIEWSGYFVIDNDRWKEFLQESFKQVGIRHKIYQFSTDDFVDVAIGELDHVWFGMTDFSKCLIAVQDIEGHMSFVCLPKKDDYKVGGFEKKALLFGGGVGENGDRVLFTHNFRKSISQSVCFFQ